MRASCLAEIHRKLGSWFQRSTPKTPMTVSVKARRGAGAHFGPHDGVIGT
ncbi:hypothetical protein FHT76_005393 [Rhizobium sp. BK176]|nr:hypothetical protein [Rhizobium sp. BK661]MCS4093699.1 hypothetical protein [Rhizobium sp. BK176]